MRIAASKRRLGFNRLGRARVEFSDSSFAGRTAISRVKLVTKLANKRNSSPFFTGNSSSSITIASKRKSAAKKLMGARKVKRILPVVSKALKWSAGWKAKPKEHFLKIVEKKEAELKK